MAAGHFSNAFFDLGEKYGIKFVRATADKIGCLKSYAGVAMPTFLFFRSGEMIDSMRGADEAGLRALVDEHSEAPVPA